MPRQQETTLGELVVGRTFTIPDYQRPYAWDEKQLRDLWDDIDLMGQGRHYTGTLVLLERDDQLSSPDITQWEVVDGQQRLTTTFLLLDRLRRQLAALHIREAQALAQELRAAYGEITVDWELRPRLELSGELNEYWHASILNDQPASLAGLQGGHQLLRRAADFFDARIHELLSEDDQVTAGRLTDLAHRVTHGLRFLIYEVSSSADVGVIFESLNDRGRGLTELEKIKNYLLYLARQMPPSARDHVVRDINRAWADMFDNFAAAPSVNEESVLRAHWIATQEGDARRWRGALSVKSKFPRSKYVPDTERLMPAGGSTGEDPWRSLRADILGYVGTLRLCSLYARELASDHPQFVDFISSHQEAARAGKTLRDTKFGLVRFYPVLFASRLANPTDGRLYTDLVRLCETFVVRVLLITQWRTHTGSSSLNRLGREICGGRVSAEDARARLSDLIRTYADDDLVRRHLEQYDNWYSRHGHKFLLYEYEKSLLKPGASPPDFSAFTDKTFKETTEHILPRTPAEGSQWLVDFSTEERKALTHTLGNLVLTLDNSRYSNHDFTRKRGTSDTPAHVPCYFNGSLNQERHLALEFERWTPTDVRLRQENLTRWILDRWSLPAGATAQIGPSVEDVLEDEAQALDSEAQHFMEEDL